MGNKPRYRTYPAWLALKAATLYTKMSTGQVVAKLESEHGFRVSDQFVRRSAKTHGVMRSRSESNFLTACQRYGKNYFTLRRQLVKLARSRTMNASELGKAVGVAASTATNILRREGFAYFLLSRSEAVSARNVSLFQIPRDLIAELYPNMPTIEVVREVERRTGQQVSRGVVQKVAKERGIARDRSGGALMRARWKRRHQNIQDE